MSSRGRSPSTSLLPVGEMKEARQAHQAITTLCDGVIDEAHRLMTNMIPATTRTRPRMPPPPRPRAAPPTLQPEATAVAAVSSSHSMTADILRTSHSYYDPAFCSYKGKVFYSKDNTLKLIAFDRNGDLFEKPADGAVAAAAPRGSAIYFSSKKDAAKKKPDPVMKKEKSTSRRGTSASSSKKAKSQLIMVEKKSYRGSSSTVYATAQPPYAASAVSTTKSHSTKTAKSSNLPKTVSALQAFEKDGIEYHLQLEGLVMGKVDVKQLTVNGITHYL